MADREESGLGGEGESPSVYTGPLLELNGFWFHHLNDISPRSMVSIISRVREISTSDRLARCRLATTRRERGTGDRFLRLL